MTTSRSALLVALLLVMSVGTAEAQQDHCEWLFRYGIYDKRETNTRVIPPNTSSQC